jgi:hypothetical protein
MTGNKAFVVVAVTIALGFLGTTSTASAHSRNHVHGYVLPCSLDGVNAVYHPDIFGNPAWAREYGFVQGADHVWPDLPAHQSVL